MNIEYTLLLNHPDLAGSPYQLFPTIQKLINKLDPSKPAPIQQSYLLAFCIHKLLSKSSPAEHEKQQELAKILDAGYALINGRTVGTYLNYELSLNLIHFMMEIKKPLSYELSSNILKLLTQWVGELQNINKTIRTQKPANSSNGLDLFAKIDSMLWTDCATQIQDQIVFINYVFKDLIGILPAWITEASALSTKDRSQVSQTVPEPISSPHFKNAVKLVDKLSPRILHLISLQRKSFNVPITVNSAEHNAQTLSLLYLNQNVDSILRRNQNTNSLKKMILKGLVKHMSLLELKDQETVVDCVFRYYSANHVEDKKLSINLVLDALENTATITRFALSKEITTFLAILQDLGHHDVRDILIKKYDWIKVIADKNGFEGQPKNCVQPFYGNEISILVNHGVVSTWTIQIFRPFSIVYFDISCKSSDINVKFCYLGSLNTPNTDQRKRVILEKNKLKFKEPFKGSIEVLLSGLYCFEFDNSYSWMTSKTIGLRVVTLASMDVESLEAETSHLYHGLLKSQIDIKQNKKVLVNLPNPGKPAPQVSSQSKVVELSKAPTCVLTVENDGSGGVVLLDDTRGHTYEYQFEGTSESKAQKITNKIRSQLQKLKIGSIVFTVNKNNKATQSFKLEDVRMLLEGKQIVNSATELKMQSPLKQKKEEEVEEEVQETKPSENTQKESPNSPTEASIQPTPTPKPQQIPNEQMNEVEDADQAD